MSERTREFLVQVRVTEEERDGLHALAEERGVTVSDLVRAQVGLMEGGIAPVSRHKRVDALERVLRRIQDHAGNPRPKTALWACRKEADRALLPHDHSAAFSESCGACQVELAAELEAHLEEQRLAAAVERQAARASVGAGQGSVGP